MIADSVKLTLGQIKSAIIFTESMQPREKSVLFAQIDTCKLKRKDRW